MANKKDRIIIESKIHSIPNPEISIIIPIAENITDARLFASVKSCITAVQKYGDVMYEILLVSEMNTFEEHVNAVKSFYFRFNTTSYILKASTPMAETLNIGVDYTKGKYVFIHYPNAIMDENRIINQINDLKDHHISCASTSVIKYNNSVYTFANIDDMYSIMFNSAGFAFRREAYTMSSQKFEPYYDEFITKFCFSAIYSNDECSIICSSNIASNCMKLDERNIEQIHRTYNFSCGGELTCIIAFRNEREEVERTVQSIRATANKVNIILVDDCSDDGTEYARILNKFRCIYIRHDRPMGASISKNDGVKLCSSRYFILLDAHMRFYNEGWDEILLKELKAAPENLYCFNTICFSKDGKYSKNDVSPKNVNHKMSVAGARIIMDTQHVYNLKWLNNSIVKDLDICAIPAVLGATYATSKNFWDKIHGYDGLIGIGFEEPFISLKTWMLGHKCFVINKIGVGHYYRDSHPYTVQNNAFEANRIFLAKWFMDEETYNDFTKCVKSFGVKDEAFELANTMYENTKEIREEFNNNIKVPYSIMITENQKLEKFS